MQEGKDHFLQRARVSGKYLILIVLCDFNWQTKNKEWLTFGYMLCIAFALCKWNGQFLFVNWTQFELAGGMRGVLHIVCTKEIVAGLFGIRRRFSFTPIQAIDGFSVLVSVALCASTLFH